MTPLQLARLLDVVLGEAPQPGRSETIRSLAIDELVEVCEQGWQLTRRGQVFLEHVLRLPLPHQATVWRMPGDWHERELASDDPRPSAQAVETRRILDDVVLPRVFDEDTPPPPPPKPKPIHGVTPAADPDERMRQAGELLERGFGLNEVAETLEMDARAIDRHFYPESGA